jgi:hypothetical protein
LVLNGPHWSYAATRLIDGQATEVRLDGVHLNMAGSIYLANYIAAYVSRILGGGARARLASKRVAVQILEGAPRKG